MRAIDIANFFVDISVKSSDNDLTTMKLIKLVYFAQALHLAKHNTPLFDETIQAWAYGPVVPSVYTEFKKYGRCIITKPTDDTYLSGFSPADIDFLTDIELYYGKYSAIELSRQSHVKGGPWETVYQEGVRNIEIPNALMADYYKHEPFRSFKLDISKIHAIGRRDEDGNLVLPAELHVPEDEMYVGLYGESRK